jgi:hypothetical protein
MCRWRTTQHEGFISIYLADLHTREAQRMSAFINVARVADRRDSLFPGRGHSGFLNFFGACHRPLEDEVVETALSSGIFVRRTFLLRVEDLPSLAPPIAKPPRCTLSPTVGSTK